jgi:hypothetical protein
MSARKRSWDLYMEFSRRLSSDNGSPLAVDDSKDSVHTCRAGRSRTAFTLLAEHDVVVARRALQCANAPTLLGEMTVDMLLDVRYIARSRTRLNNPEQIREGRGFGCCSVQKVPGLSRGVSPQNHIGYRGTSWGIWQLIKRRYPVPLTDVQIPGLSGGDPFWR